jgi:hypothetical protein
MTDPLVELPREKDARRAAAAAAALDAIRAWRATAPWPIPAAALPGHRGPGTGHRTTGSGNDGQQEQGER